MQSSAEKKQDGARSFSTARIMTRSGSSESESDASRSPSPTSKFLYGKNEGTEDRSLVKSPNQQTTQDTTRKAWTSMLDIPIPAVTAEKSPEKKQEPKSTLDERIKDFK